MRMQVSRLLTIAVATLTIAAGAAAIAHADETLATGLKVPFAFIVGDTRLPAGDYVVREAEEGGGVVEIASGDGRRVVFAPTIPWDQASQPAGAELVFRKFDDAYFLSRVLPVGGNDRQIVLTPALMEHEIMMVREHAAN
jgi:hypothetical protein